MAAYTTSLGISELDPFGSAELLNWAGDLFEVYNLDAELGRRNQNISMNQIFKDLMTFSDDGHIVLQGGDTVRVDANSRSAALVGGTAKASGAYLEVFGDSHATTPGQVEARIKGTGSFKITTAAFGSTTPTTLVAVSPSGSVAITQGTIAAAAPAIDASVTWNNSGVTFVGQKLNVTDTASASASLLTQVQLGGTDVLVLRKDGRWTLTGRISATTISALGHVFSVSDALNTTSVLVGQFNHSLSSGTAAAGMGVLVDFTIDSTTTAATRAARWSTVWTDATHATRTASTTFNAFVSGTETPQMVVGNNQIGGPVGVVGAPSWVNRNDTTTGSWYPAASTIAWSLGGVEHLRIGTTALTLVSRLLLPNTTSATVGGIYFGGVLAIHNFGTNNIFIGARSGNLTMTGSESLGFGPDTLKLNTSGSFNSAIGSGSLVANTTGSLNTGIGYATVADNTTGAANTGLGYAALRFTQTGDHNTGVGYGAGLGVAASSYSNNTLLGSQSGYALTTGSQNTLVGRLAGDNLTTGSGNIVIGYNLDSPTATNSNTLIIGGIISGSGLGGASSKIGLGPSSTPCSNLCVNNSTTATVSNFYETTDGLAAPTDYRRFTITTQAGNTLIRTEAGGTGLVSGQPRILQVGTGPSVGTDIAGQNVIWHSGPGTGSGTGGSHLFQVSAPGASASTERALATRLTLNTTDLTMATAVRLAVASGTNQRAGDATLVGGTVTVSNTTVTANTRVFVTRKTAGGTIGFAVTYTLSAGTSFTLTSDNVLDTSVYSYILVEVP